jgi:hypothetical protein
MHYQDLITQNIQGQGISVLKDSVQKEKAFDLLSDCAWTKDVAFALNLIWPSVSKTPVPQSQQIVLSFHTEQLDHVFIRSVADSNPDSDIIVLYDGYVYASSWWPKNIRFLRYITWHRQLENIISVWGQPKKSDRPPSHRLSALSFRQTQLKTYVIATLLQHANRDDFLLSWHLLPGYSNDMHAYQGTGRTRLDDLARKMESTHGIRVDDWFNKDFNQPMQNSNFDHPAYQDCAFNITNESWHYSFTCLDGQDFVFPGPYFTEKTWKPLLAGNGIICAGQWQSYKALQELGFKFDYGFDLGYDLIDRDLDRICVLLDVIDDVAQLTTEQLTDIAKQSGSHNQDHILSGALAQQCEYSNEQQLDSFLS